MKRLYKKLSGIEKLTRTGNKITLVNIKFSMKACKNLSSVEINNLSDTARDFFCFVQSFGNELKVHDFANLWMEEDPIRNLDTVTIFQIHCYNNLFSHSENSKIQNSK